LRLYVDSADVKQIAHLVEYFPIAGVTTNPSILVKEKRPYLAVLKDIREIIGENRELFVQTLGETADEMAEEARFIISKLPGKTIVKIPVTEEAIKAMKMLAQEKIPVLGTAIYTPFQAVMAAKAGAKYVAPYVNRMDNLNGNGVKVVSEIAKLFSIYHLKTEILAASFKNIQQAMDVCLAGAEALTLSPDFIGKLVSYPATVNDIKDFKAQWTAQFGSAHSVLGNYGEV